MSVATTITVGYGFAISQEAWEGFLDSKPKGYEDGDYEVMYALLKDRPLLVGDFGGSYYDSDFVTPVISVASQYYSEGAMYVDGGVRVFGKKGATKEELKALRKVARKFGIDESEFAPFLAVLWH